MWRNGAGRQRKRRLGRAWLEQDPGGRWVKRRGRIPSDYLEMGRVIAEVEAELQPEPGGREPLFDDAAAAWLEHLETERRAKPSTLAAYRNLLSHPRHGDRPRSARIMRLQRTEAAPDSDDDVRRFLSSLRKTSALAPSTCTARFSTRSSSTRCAATPSECGRIPSQPPQATRRR